MKEDDNSTDLKSSAVELSIVRSSAARNNVAPPATEGERTLNTRFSGILKRDDNIANELKLPNPKYRFDEEETQALINFFSRLPRELLDHIDSLPKHKDFKLHIINLSNNVIVRKVPQYTSDDRASPSSAETPLSTDEEIKLHAIYLYEGFGLSRPARDEVRLLYWDTNKSTGHVALEIFTLLGEYLYVSYWLTLFGAMV